jgi:hypothetical protein
MASSRLSPRDSGSCSPDSRGGQRSARRSARSSAAKCTDGGHAGHAYPLRHREILTQCPSAAIRRIISRSFPAASRDVRRSAINGGA